MQDLADTLALPRFPARPGRDQAVLDASRAVVALLLHTQSADHAIRALATHAGLSERTFYRYFPHKEDAVRPYLEAGMHRVLDAVREAPRERPLPDVLLDAQGALLDLGGAQGGAGFMAVLAGTERLRSMWITLLADAEEAFASVLATRLGVPEDALQARLLAAVVVTAGRIAITRPSSSPPSETFRAALTLAAHGLFAPMSPRS